MSIDYVQPSPPLDAPLYSYDHSMNGPLYPTYTPEVDTVYKTPSASSLVDSLSEPKPAAPPSQDPLVLSTMSSTDHSDEDPSSSSSSGPDNDSPDDEPDPDDDTYKARPDPDLDLTFRLTPSLNPTHNKPQRKNEVIAKVLTCAEWWHYMRHLNPFDETVYRPAKPPGLENWTPPPSPTPSTKSVEEMKEEEERRVSEKEAAIRAGEWPWMVPRSPKWRGEEVEGVGEDETIRCFPSAPAPEPAAAPPTSQRRAFSNEGDDDEDRTTVTTILALATHYPELPDTPDDPLDVSEDYFDEPRSHFSDDSDDDDDYYDTRGFDSGEDVEEDVGNTSGFTFANEDTLLSDDENDDSRTLPPPTPLRHGSSPHSDSDSDSGSDSDDWGAGSSSGDEGFFEAHDSGEDSYDEDKQEGNLQEGYTYHRGEHSYTHRGRGSFF